MKDEGDKKKDRGTRIEVKGSRSKAQGVGFKDPVTSNE